MRMRMVYAPPPAVPLIALPRTVPIPPPPPSLSYLGLIPSTIYPFPHTVLSKVHALAIPLSLNGCKLGLVVE